jgi:hypothetical protein
VSYNEYIDDEDEGYRIFEDMLKDTRGLTINQIKRRVFSRIMIKRRQRALTEMVYFKGGYVQDFRGF